MKKIKGSNKHFIVKGQKRKTAFHWQRHLPYRHHLDQKLGGDATDEMRTTFTVSVTDVCPAPIYIGEIVTADGVINAAP